MKLISKTVVGLNTFRLKKVSNKFLLYEASIQFKGQKEKKYNWGNDFNEVKQAYLSSVESFLRIE
jgi:hypothetical protein